MAEKFQKLLDGKELPGIDGTLDVQWATGTSTSTKPQPRPVASSDVTAKKDKEDNEQYDEDGGIDGISRPTRQGQEQEQSEMDYERPEDDDDAY